MRCYSSTIFGILFLVIMLMSGCVTKAKIPRVISSVDELLKNPAQEEEVDIYGQVSLLDELFCPCFELSSGGEKILVWYDLMVEEDGGESPAVSVEHIDNGDQVIVTGVLKLTGAQSNPYELWAIEIEKVD
jgi:hypothetical protein